MSVGWLIIVRDARWPWNVETWWDGPLFSIFTLRMDEINYAMGWVTIGAGAKWSFESAFHWKIGCYLCSDEGVWSGDVWVSTWALAGVRYDMICVIRGKTLEIGALALSYLRWTNWWRDQCQWCENIEVVISGRPLDGGVNLFRGMRMHADEFKASFLLGWVESSVRHWGLLEWRLNGVILRPFGEEIRWRLIY